MNIIGSIVAEKECDVVKNGGMMSDAFHECDPSLEFEWSEKPGLKGTHNLKI